MQNLYPIIEKETQFHAHQVTVTNEMLHALGPTNLKNDFEIARQKFCSFLSLKEEVLQPQFRIKIFLMREIYQYQKPLNQGNIISFLPTIIVADRQKIMVSLYVCKWSPTYPRLEIIADAVYEIGILSLKDGHQVDIPSRLIDGIKHFNATQIYFRHQSTPPLTLQC